MIEQRHDPAHSDLAAALEASERQIRQILETAHDAFISLDSAGMVTGWNAQATAVFGWSRDDALGRELAAMLVPEDRREAHRRGIERFLATGEEHMLGRRLELMVLHRDGYEFLVELTISALETPDGYAFHAFLRDITESRRAQAELALARDQALQASRTKSMFVASVSHEIRTPMNGVIGMTELLLGTDLDPEQRAYAETISSSGEALLEVIDDILDLSKIEAGKLELDPAGFDPRAVVERACGMLAARARQKGLGLVVTVDPAMPALLHGDGARLRQVIANLVSNAIKFTAHGEVVVRATSHRAGDGATCLRVEVSDTGIGIERRALRRVFMPFAQADGSTTRKYGGTGLGLAISRELIELMGGTLDADSEPGAGSRFWFSVTLPPADRASPEIGGAQLEPAPTRPGPGGDVLVVEDGIVNQTVALHMLERGGFRGHVAANGVEALRLVATRPFAAVLMDCQMPELDGYETTREIRRREPGQPRVPIIAMTAGSMRGERERCLAAGMDDYLTKPLRSRVLLEALWRWVPAPDDRGGELLDEHVLDDLTELGGPVLAKLLSAYTGEAENDLAQLERAVRRGDMTAAGDTAHRLKGTSATVGAARVAQIASEVEVAAAGDSAGARELLDALRGAFDDTAQAMRGRVAQPTGVGT